MWTAPGPPDLCDRRAPTGEDDEGGRRALPAPRSPGGGEPGAAVAQATDVTGGGGAAKSTTCGVPRRDGQRDAAGAKRRTRRARGARPDLPGVERLERCQITRPSLEEMTGRQFQVSRDQKRSTLGHLKGSAAHVQLSSS